MCCSDNKILSNFLIPLSFITILSVWWESNPYPPAGTLPVKIQTATTFVLSYAYQSYISLCWQSYGGFLPQVVGTKNNHIFHTRNFTNAQLPTSTVTLVVTNPSDTTWWSDIPAIPNSTPMELPNGLSSAECKISQSIMTQFYTLKGSGLHCPTITLFSHYMKQSLLQYPPSAKLSQTDFTRVVQNGFNDLSVVYPITHSSMLPLFRYRTIIAYLVMARFFLHRTRLFPY